MFWKSKQDLKFEEYDKLNQLAKAYLEGLSKLVKDKRRVSEIQDSIKEKGYWEESIEWRISTVTRMRVEPIEKDGKQWYKVQVECDYEMVCHCPTIDRAVEFLGVYERLIADLFYTLGWASWTSLDKLEP
jgi:hypothetical protein